MSLQSSLGVMVGGNATEQELANKVAGTVNLTTQEALNIAAGTTGNTYTTQIALNVLAGDVANSKSEQGSADSIASLGDYTTKTGTLAENFETLGDWTKGASGTMTADTTNFKTGAASLQLAALVSNSCLATKTVSLDLSNALVIKYSVYTADPSNISAVTLYFSNDAGFTNFYSRAISTSGNFTKGWNTITIPRGLFSATGSPSWSSTIVRLRVRLDAAAGGGQSVSFDSLYAGNKHRPKVVLTFDDGWDTQLTEGYTYMATKGLKGVCYVPNVTIGTANYMTVANLRTLYEAGWDIGNHGYTHTNLTTLGTQAEMESEISLNKDWLDGLGFTRASSHFAYPNGGYNDTVLAAMAAQNMLTGRTVLGTTAVITAQPPDNPYIIRIQNLGNANSLASVKATIDTCVDMGTVLFVNGHKLVALATADTEWAIADFQSLIDYLYNKVTTNKLDMVTVSEWYNGL